MGDSNEKHPARILVIGGGEIGRHLIKALIKRERGISDYQESISSKLKKTGVDGLNLPRKKINKKERRQHNK